MPTPIGYESLAIPTGGAGAGLASIPTSALVAGAAIMRIRIATVGYWLDVPTSLCPQAASAPNASQGIAMYLNDPKPLVFSGDLRNFRIMSIVNTGFLDVIYYAGGVIPLTV
jgi:hypothetical protein